MADQWDKISSKRKTTLLRVARASAIQVGTEIIKKSPVDTGRFRSNWMTSIGAPDNSIDGQGGGLLPMTKGLKIGDVIFFTNSLPYAQRLEFGWSDQAPHGMVRLSVARWQIIVDQMMRKQK